MINARCGHCKHWKEGFHTILGWLGSCKQHKIGSYIYSKCKEFEPKPVELTLPDGTKIVHPIKEDKEE